MKTLLPSRETSGLVDFLNRFLGNARPFVFGLQVIEHHDALTLPVAVELNPTDLVRLVTATEQLQSEESPVSPGQVLQLGEIVEARVIQRERIRAEFRPLVPNLLAQVQHALLDRVDRQFAAVDPGPAPAEFLCDSQSRA